MKVGDLVTHRPTGAIGIIIREYTYWFCVVWYSDPMYGKEGQEDFIEKEFVEEVKNEK